MLKHLEFPQRRNLENTIEFIEYEHWWDFAKKKAEVNSIFRGQSNFKKHPISEIHKVKRPLESEISQNQIDNINFEVWETKSTFHRNYLDTEFHTFKYKYTSLIQNIELYREHLKPFIGDLDINSITFLQLMQLMQHYGVGTPLIDFTYDKDTALYFALSGLNDQGINTNISEDGGNRFITIVELRLDILKGLGLLSEINDDHLLDSLNYNNFFIYNPMVTLNNENIYKQNGVFIYLDNEYSLEQYLSYEIFDIDRNNNFSDELLRIKPVVWHMIPYSSMDFGKFPESPNEEYDIFAYLLMKRKLGCFLFNDLRGIEHDMKNSKIRLHCVTNQDDCNCKKKIESSDWYNLMKSTE